jgi:exodeoxyribonuclease VII small subunit
MAKTAKRSSGAEGVAETAGEADNAPGRATSFDAVLAELEAVVTELERGDLPLERALSRFESGVHFAKTGEKLLREVELRVEELLSDRGERAPFAVDVDEESDDDSA